MALRLLGFKVGIKSFNFKNSARFFATNTPVPAYEQSQHVVARVEVNGHYIEDTGDFVLTDRSPGKDPIDMIAAVPPIEIEGRVASCNGGHGALGHPKVYVNVDKGVHACGYCGLRYVQKEGHHGGHH